MGGPSSPNDYCVSPKNWVFDGFLLVWTQGQDMGPVGAEDWQHFNFWYS